MERDCESGAGGAWISGCSPRVVARSDNHIFRWKTAVTRGAEAAAEASGSVVERGDVGRPLRSELPQDPAPSIGLCQAHWGRRSPPRMERIAADAIWKPNWWDAFLGQGLFSCPIECFPNIIQSLFLSHMIIAKNKQTKKHANEAPCFES